MPVAVLGFANLINTELNHVELLYTNITQIGLKNPEIEVRNLFTLLGKV